jgi:hypothetical protein
MKKQQMSLFIWLSVIIVVIAAVIIGLQVKKNTAGEALDAESLETLLIENEDVWLHDGTAGICLLDLDFDGTPELLATDTQIVWYDELGSNYFGNSDVNVYSLKNGEVTPLGSYSTDEYCFLASVHLFAGANGSKGWYYTSEGDVWLLSLENGSLAAKIAASIPDISGGDEAKSLMRNESWVSNLGDVSDTAAIAEDVKAISAEYFAVG